MNRKIFFVILVLLLLLIVFNVAAAQSGGKDLVRSGLEKFTKGQYQEALVDFREIVLNPSFENYYDVAYFWISRCYMEQNELSKAETNLEFFIQNFPESSFYPESIYQKGRLLYLQKDYEDAIQALYFYLKSYPNGNYGVNAYFWTAESLFTLGQFDKAQKIYGYIIENYPKNYKVEASRYKYSLIDLKIHEEELLKLLRSSHEEYLAVIYDFQNREKTYEQAIVSYQRKLAATANNDTKKLLDEMNKEISIKDKQIAQLKGEIVSLKKEVDNSKAPAASPVSSISNNTGSSKLIELLKLKNEVLNLKSFYLDWLASSAGE